MTRGGPVIGVWGHYADANIGDDACPSALLYHLKRLIPTARFVMFCRFPKVAQTIWPLPAFPVRPLAAGADGPRSTTPTARNASRWRARARAIPFLRALVRAARATAIMARALPTELRFAWQSYQRLRGVDLFVVTGSNPLFDFFGGFWAYPYRVWQWTFLARLAGARVAFVSVGAGPIVSTRSGRLLVRALRRADYVSFRDEGSRRLMREHGYDGAGDVCPDLALSLPFDVRPAARTERLRVGINPMIVHHSAFWPVTDPKLQRGYIDSLATLAAALVAAGHDVFFYGTQTGDQVTAEETQAAMRTTAPAAPVPAFVMPGSVNALLELCATADILVTTRFHGAIFGVRTARPTLAICYQPKTREVLAAAGLHAHAIDFAQISAERLALAFDRLCADRHDVERRLREHISELRTRLERQYEALARSVPRDVPQKLSLNVAGTIS